MIKKNMEEEIVHPYSFALKRIDLIEKSFRAYYKKEGKIDYDYDISLQISPSPDDNQCFHFISVNIFPKDSKKDFIATVGLGFIFEVIDLKSIVVSKGDTITLPNGLLNLLNAVVIGTMRGVLFSELRGTQFEDAILPVLDPTKFQQE